MIGGPRRPVQWESSARGSGCGGRSDRWIRRKRVGRSAWRSPRGTLRYAVVSARSKPIAIHSADPRGISRGCPPRRTGRSDCSSRRGVAEAHGNRGARSRGVRAAAFDDQGLDGAMAGPAAVTGAAGIGDLLAGAGTGLDARPDLLVGDSLAQANDHGFTNVGNESQFQEGFLRGQ